MIDRLHAVEKKIFKALEERETSPSLFEFGLILNDILTHEDWEILEKFEKGDNWMVGVLKLARDQG